MTYLLQHFVDVDFVSLNVLLGFLALFPWSLGASFHHGLLLGLRWPSGFLQTLTLPSLLLPFYSLRWSHVPPCHAALQQQQKRKREMQIAAQNPYPEHSNATKTTNNKREESRKTCASPEVLFSSPPFLVPRLHVNFLVLFLFPIHTWILQSIDYSSFTRKFSCPRTVPCSHFNFIVIFLVHTSVYHPFLVPCSHVNITIFYFLLLADSSHVNFPVFFFFPRSHVKFSVVPNSRREFLYFTNFWSPCSPREFHNLSSIFLFPNHRWNFTFYHHYYNMWLSSLCGLLKFEKTWINLSWWKWSISQWIKTNCYGHSEFTNN